MTKEIILPMNEITDSVEMLHEKPNKEMPIFTWILVLLLVVVLTWCCIGEVDYFIKASGVVRPGESVSTISSLMTGRVETLNISTLEYSLKGQNKNFSAYSEISHDEQLAAENMKLEMLSEIAESVKSNEASINSLEKQIADIELNIRNAEVIAPINGTVNMYADLSKADLVQSGQTIATIIPDTKGAYKLMMYLSSADIGETEIGQSVRLRFAAYPYQEYGELAGTVKSISTDVRSSENCMSYYVAEVSIDDTLGLELVSGMECETRVVTKQRKIIYWLLEKLDFIDD